MRYFLTLLALCLFTLSVWAQPANDNCSGLIDLGLAPFCTDDLYTNVDATLSDIGFGNNPSCFNGGTAQNDVFFAFTVDPSMVDLTISVTGSDLGPNAESISNPQIALYRGACIFDGLAELLCVSTAIGETAVHLDAIALTPGITYFIRVNDYSDTGTPNWGDFQLCVEEYIPAINIGEEPTSAACFGTLFDSGGPEDDYGDGENNTFTVCPTDFTQCIAIDVVSFEIENGLDFLNIFAGTDITAPSIASLTGSSSGSDFEILATSSCVTFQFTSDGNTINEGFEVNWQCFATTCDASSFDNPTPIAGIPFNNNTFTTCDQGATLNETPCDNVPFLNGPETVFSYTSEGGYCASVEVTNADPGTGVIVLSGPLSDPETVCLGDATDGSISNVSFEEPGVYYIVVANAGGCTDFGLSINEVDCSLSPALVDALCNPLNGCTEDGTTTEFTFENGLEDIPIVGGVNNGAWGGTGPDPDFYWFTIEAQADGNFGFLLENADVASDIDYNVWGPFNPEEVCETPQQTIDFITNNQPIRSSWSGLNIPTGLIDTHPTDNYAIDDVYEGAGGDAYTTTIQVQSGEVYVILVNDYSLQDTEENLLVDWSPSDQAVLDQVATMVAVNDTSICGGESILIEVVTSLDNIEWIGDNLDELSCTDCFTPTATPPVSRTYKAIVDAVCYTDTIDVLINVFDLNAGPDVTTCIGEEFDIPAGDDFETASYTWSPPAGLDFSCTDCATPSVIAQTAGVYDVPVSLEAESCSFMDMVMITVLDSPAPEYTIATDTTICIGETVMLGGDTSPDHNYEWTAVPAAGPIDPIANPAVTPNETTTYYLNISNGACPVPSLDSVTVTVTQYPIIDIVESMDTICKGDTITLTNVLVEEDVSYSWQGNETIFTPDSVFTQVIPASTGTYTLIADRLGCQIESTIDIEVIDISIDLNQPDTTLICFGEELSITPTVSPIGTIIEWSQDGITSNAPTLVPSTNSTLIATITEDICIRMDTMYIQVDSIPMDMSIAADPMEDSYCQGELVQLISPIYEPANYPNITHKWENIGGETSDTLYNFVLTTVDTFTFIRTTTSGACMNMDSITLNVITPESLNITPPEPEICPGESVDLLLTADALGDLEWEPAESLSCADCPNPTASPSVSTTYTVSSDIEGCPVETSVMVIVLEALNIDLIDDQVACEGTTFNLNLGPNQASTTYSWTSSTDPAFSSTESTITVTAGAPTVYSLNATNACGEFNGQVSIAQTVEPSIAVPGELTVCIGSPFNLEGTVNNGQDVTSQVWIYDGESELGADVDFIATNSGYAYFNVAYGNTTENCGNLVDSVFINVVDQVYTIDIATDPAGIAGDTIIGGTTFTLNGIVDPTDGFDYTYSWVGDGVESPNISTTLVNVPNVADPNNPLSLDVFVESYTLNVSTPEGCDQTATITVSIQPAGYDIPNIFSPNGDGTNDEFKLFTNTIPTAYSLRVFNRWGQLVFETNDPTVGWNGEIDGNPAPSDVYIYQMEATSPTIPAVKSGNVTLIR